MKFEMTDSEFSNFCTHLGGDLSAVKDLEAKLEKTYYDLDIARRDLELGNAHLDQLNQSYRYLESKNATLLRENTDLQKQVQVLQDKLDPFRKERALSTAFAFIREKKKIQAIKEIRTLYQLGLKEAKELVEGTYDGGEIELIILSRIFGNIGETPINILRDQFAPYTKLVVPEEIARVVLGTYHL